VVLLGDRRERKMLLDIVDSWDEMMEPNGFAISTSPRTLRFFPAHELTWSPVEHFRSHSRTCRFSSARTSA
jgi:hypothetical protein